MVCCILWEETVQKYLLTVSHSFKCCKVQLTVVYKRKYVKSLHCKAVKGVQEIGVLGGGGVGLFFYWQKVGNWKTSVQNICLVIGHCVKCGSLQPFVLLLREPSSLNNLYQILISYTGVTLLSYCGQQDKTPTHTFHTMYILVTFRVCLEQEEKEELLSHCTQWI